MILEKVVLNNFRNYKLGTFDLDKRSTLLVGPNAIGKTSIIEAIYLLSTADSFRSGKIDEMISFENEISRVSGRLSELGDTKDSDFETIEILLNKGIVSGKRTQKRLYTVNSAKKRRKDFVGKFLCVVFRPEDMRLIEGSKTRRRNFIDESLSVLDWQYDRSLKMYEEAHLKKNKLLWQIKEGLAPKTTLKYWNLTILKHGQYLQTMRQKFLDSFVEVDFPLRFRVEYVPSIISQERQDEYEGREISSGHSLIGPHKDDFIVHLKDHLHQQTVPDFDVAIYGSRGQQRMAVLWLKVCQLKYLEKVSNQKALLLLDDIFSELDAQMREKVIGLLYERQSIITSADVLVKDELKKYIGEIKILDLNQSHHETKF
ncbi:AAA family ATPase [Patescibacteria group bacterium]|nr:AAA family ATPase [Patescibacteria group bacterium]